MTIQAMNKKHILHFDLFVTKTAIFFQALDIQANTSWGLVF